MKKLYFNTAMAVFIENVTLGELASMGSLITNIAKRVKSAIEVRDKNVLSCVLCCNYHKIIFRLLHRTKKDHLYIILITLAK